MLAVALAVMTELASTTTSSSNNCSSSSSSSRAARRRHSSVGFLPLHEQPAHPAHAAHSDLSPTSRLAPSFFLDAGLKLHPGLHRPGEVVIQGRKLGDKGPAAANGRVTRGSGSSGGDSKVRAAPTDSKLMVMGMAGVGKSALVVRFLTNRFIWEYDPTLEATYRHVTSVDDEPVVMEILDTAGQQDVTSQRECSVRWADGFVLVYAINDRASFQCLAALKQHLDDVRKTNVQCVLVANKCDLLHERKVESSEGEALAQDMACAFYETSASDGGSDITELFHELHREVKRRKSMESKGRRRSSAQQVRSVFNRVLNKINSAT